MAGRGRIGTAAHPPDQQPRADEELKGQIGDEDDQRHFNAHEFNNRSNQRQRVSPGRNARRVVGDGPVQIAVLRAGFGEELFGAGDHGAAQGHR